jgi:hypothetical protein
MEVLVLVLQRLKARQTAVHPAGALLWQLMQDEGRGMSVAQRAAPPRLGQLDRAGVEVQDEGWDELAAVAQQFEKGADLVSGPGLLANSCHPGPHTSAGSLVCF